MANGAWFFTPGEDEDLNAFRAQQAKQAGFAQQYTPEQARSVAQLAASYPNLQAGAAVALGLNGVTPSNPVARAAAQAIDSVIKKKKGYLHRKFNSTVRGALTTMEAPYQFYSGIGRYVGGKLSEGELPVDIPDMLQSASIQTNLGVALQKRRNGEHVDQGSGFFTNPQSEVGKLQSAAARDAWTIKGNHAATLGRVVAQRLYEPDTASYNHLSGVIDAITVLGLDPTNKAGVAVSKARVARKSFIPPEAAGLFSLGRKVQLDDQADEFLSSPAGEKFIEWAAKNDSMDDIWKTTSKKWDVEFAAKVADTKDPALVKALMREEIIQGKMANKPYMNSPFTRWKPEGGWGESGLGIGLQVKRSARDVRMFNALPGKHFLLNDLDQAVEQLDRTLHNGNLPAGEISAWNGKLARATDVEQRRTIILNAMESLQEHIISKDIPKAQARRMTKLFKDSDPALTAFMKSEMEQGADVPWLRTIHGEHRVARSSLIAEGNDEMLPGLSTEAIKEMRIATSKYKSVFGNPAVRVSDRALQWGTAKWKPAVLLRGAYTVRVVGEEQIRMAMTNNLVSAASHPLRAISWVVSDPNIKVKLPGIEKDISLDILNKIPGVNTGRGSTDVFGQHFGDEAAARNGVTEFGQALNQLKGGDRLVKRRAFSHYLSDVRQDSEHFVPGWGEEVGVLASDPVAQRVAGGFSPGDLDTLTGNAVDDAKTWFKTTPGGQKFRKQLSQRKGWERMLTDDSLADEYIDHVNGLIEAKTLGHADLKQLVATSKLNGKAPKNSDLHNLLQGLVDEGKAPTAVKAPVSEIIGKQKGFMDPAVDHLFDALMTRPTNWLSRSSTFRQFYWQRIEQLAPSMTPAAQQKVLRGAREAKMDSATIDRMTDLIAKSNGKGVIDLDGADLVAKAHGLDKTQSLLYSHAERNQFFDMARTIFPFGEAWAEMLGVWAKIGTDDPTIMRRGQLAIEGARDSGFFYTDPDSHQEVYAIPYSGKINKRFTGIDAPFKGSVKGLNLFSNNPLIPGISPFFQWPAGHFIPSTPEWDGVRRNLLPMGNADMSNGIVESFAPAWMKKWIIAATGDPIGDADFNATVGQVLRAKMDSGAYSMDSPADLDRLEKDAGKTARVMYFLRGAAQFWAPSAPSPKWLAHDQNGNMTTASALVGEYHALQKPPEEGGVGFDRATEAFIERFGEDSLLYMQPLSQGGFNPTEDLHDWVRANPELTAAYRNSYGYFGPSDGEYSFAELDRQMATGEKSRLKPREVLELANSRVATARYKTARESLGSSPDEGQRAWLKEYQQLLADSYPGYKPEVFTPSKAAQRIREFEKAVKDPRLANNKVVGVMSVYMEAREQALASDPNFARNNKRSRATRDWLRDIGASLAASNPEFSRVWVEVLSNEMHDDAKDDAASAQEEG